jgi:hypothetical protein
MVQLKKVISFIAFVLLSGFQLLYGQVQGTQPYVERSEELLSRLRLNHTITGREEITYDQIEGDPFLYKDFALGAMVLTNGDKYPLNLRYDIFTGEVQFKVKEGTFRIANAEDISTILIDTLKFQYLGYLKAAGNSSSAERSWFILKTDGKCKLLIRKNLRLQAAELPKPYQEARPAKFIHQADTYYLKPAGGNAVRITGKKDILNILSDKSAEISKFINLNKLGAKDEDDLAKIISYYNSLL